MKNIVIAGRDIGEKEPQFIIAEMSGNHNQSLERALKIVNAAAKAGVDAIKLQTYTANTMTLEVHEKEFFINEKKSLWEGESLYNLYKKAYTPWEWHKPIFDRCKKLGLIAFSSPFDESAVDYLEKLDVPCYKIASFENTYLSLIKKAASTGKPLIISTGMATVSELEEAVETARNAGCKNLILLKCNSGYPSAHEETNLLTIPHMRDLFGCQVGLSDHSLGIGAALASVAFGATVIEKHFTLSRADGGVDAKFSIEPNEMKNLVAEVNRAHKALGSIRYGPTKTEAQSKIFRRSLYISQDVKAGELLTKENVRIVRPGFGLAPKYFGAVLGKKILKDMNKGTPVKWELIGKVNKN